MPSQLDDKSPEGEQRSGLQPKELPAAAQTARPAKTFWKTFLKKMGISARLAGKELQRLKIRQIDLEKVWSTDDLIGSSSQRIQHNSIFRRE